MPMDWFSLFVLTKVNDHQGGYFAGTKVFYRLPTHQPTDPPTTHHLPTDPLATYPPTYVNIEDQILNMFRIL